MHTQLRHLTEPMLLYKIVASIIYAYLLRVEAFHVHVHVLYKHKGNGFKAQLINKNNIFLAEFALNRRR